MKLPEPDYYHQFAACCRLAKAIKVVTITVRSAELGTPFNAEVERLQKLVASASREGVRVGLLTEVGRMTENPDTAVVMCDSVKGLGITLDPSHYVYGPHAGVNFEQVMKHVYPRSAPRYHQRPVPGPRRPGRRSSTAGWSTNCTSFATTGRCASTFCRWPTSTSLPRCVRCACCWRACYSGEWIVVRVG